MFIISLPSTKTGIRTYGEGAAGFPGGLQKSGAAHKERKDDFYDRTFKDRAPCKILRQQVQHHESAERYLAGRGGGGVHRHHGGERFRENDAPQLHLYHRPSHGRADLYTTLLNCISTIDRPTGGQIYIDGVCTSKLKKNALADFRRDRLGFIFQEFNLLDTLTAFDNIAIALQIQRCAPKEITGRVKEMARKLGIEDVLEKYPYQMSGGQKQRVAAARAIITRPALILADEPTGALDSRSSRVLLESMELLNREENATILMVTHDAFSASYASRVIFMKDGRLFNELRRGGDDRRVFFERIMDVVSLMGGDLNYAVPSLS